MSKVGKTILGTTLAILLGGGGAYTGYVAIQKTKLENDNKNLTEIVAVRDKEKEDLTNRLTISLSNQKQTSGLITGIFIAAIAKDVASTGDVLTNEEYQITENEFYMVDGDEVFAFPITDIGNNQFEVRYENTLMFTLTPLYDENCYWMQTSENVMPANVRMLLVKQTGPADMVHDAALKQFEKDRLELNSLRAQITTLTQEKQDLQEQLRIKTEEYNEQLEKANSCASENQTLIEQINQKQTEIDALNTQITNLQEQITQLKAQLESGKTEEPTTLSAGLYETGTTTLTKSWEQLIADGDISTADGHLQVTNKNLAGDLFCESVDGLTSLNSAFEDCEKLTLIDLSNLDTSNVTTMECLFFGCNTLRTIKLGRFDISKVIVSASGLMYYGNAFSCSVSDIFYAGTKEEWQAKNFSDDAQLQLGVTIHCTDGDLVTE